MKQIQVLVLTVIEGGGRVRDNKLLALALIFWVGSVLTFVASMDNKDWLLFVVIGWVALFLGASFMAGLMSAFVFARVNRVLGVVLAILVAAGVWWHGLSNEHNSRSANVMKRIGYSVTEGSLRLGTGAGFALGVLIFWRKKS